jgi:hypothetical protein
MKKQILNGILPLLCGLLLLTGCRKDAPVEVVAGYVREYGTNKPLDGARVYIMDSNGTFLGPGSNPTVATAITDANGFYSVPKPEYAIKANAYLSGYFTDTESETCVCTPTNETDIILYPQAWLRVKLVNESGAWGISIPGQTMFDTGQDFHVEKNQDTTTTIIRRGNKDYNFIIGISPEQWGAPLSDFSKVTIKNNDGVVIPITVNNGGTRFCTVEFIGHDTTNLTIIY